MEPQAIAYTQDLTYIFWIIAFALTIMMFVLGLYGKWIWDLNKKISKSVTGGDCERRNDNQYSDTESLRLEIKTDMGVLGDRFASGMQRLSLDRKEGMDDLKSSIDVFNKQVFEQGQTNFETIAGLLEKVTQMFK